MCMHFFNSGTELMNRRQPGASHLLLEYIPVGSSRTRIICNSWLVGGLTSERFSANLTGHPISACTCSNGSDTTQRTCGSHNQQLRWGIASFRLCLFFTH